jgi:polysaccharide deacetylase 2 family uncharacterized protein YibQ
MGRQGEHGMGRGFFAGAVVGLMVVAVGLAVLSLALSPEEEQPGTLADMPVTMRETAPDAPAEGERRAADAPAGTAPEPEEKAVGDEAPAQGETQTPAPSEAMEDPLPQTAVQSEEDDAAMTESAAAEPGIEPDATGPVIPGETVPAPAPTPSLPQITAPTTEDTVLTMPLDDMPLMRFAADYDGPAPGLPRLAVVLLDDGMGPLGPSALAAFPFPVSFAIDPDHPDPSAAADAYRALGFEVLTLARLPDGATPADVETALRSALGAVPEAVAVLEAPEGGLQASRAVAAQIASVLSGTGHGLVSVPQGLNTGQQLAVQAGVPAVTLFRDFDSEGQDPRVIRRFLDQGAFRAGQEGAVVMLGRLRADTISALVLWGLQDRAQSVALVPVSVVLRESMRAEQ